MPSIEIVDITDEAGFRLIPPCADPSFDHRSCDYWEDSDRGSKAHRASWFGAAGASDAAAGNAPADAAAGEAPAGNVPAGAAAWVPANPFAAPPRAGVNPFAPPQRLDVNPFAPVPSVRPHNPFLVDLDGPPSDNPFAPNHPARPT